MALTVVKVGGAALRDGAADPTLEDIRGVRDVCIVHGGGPEITTWTKRLGVESRFVDGLRYTDDNTMSVVEMVLCGRVGKAIAAALGPQAVSICGKDAGLLQAAPLDREKYGLVGEIHTVNAKLLQDLMSAGYLPVVAPVALGPGGTTLNVNADDAAAAVAVALKAERLILATDVPGVLVPGQDQPVESLTPAEARDLIATGIAHGGMRPKLEACMRAVDGGVTEAWIVDGRRAGSVASRRGTCLRQGAA